MRVRSIGVL